MSRILFFALLLACVFYVLQAVPVPDDPQQAATNDLDTLESEAKKMLDEAKELFSNVNLTDALETARSYLGQAGETIRKEIQKFSDNVQG